jgi:internalin A
MHGTHRYFLTRRSLYLLVLEDRREDDQSALEWLKTIRNRGKDSPIIVVTNKCYPDRQGLRLEEEELKEAYPEIVSFVRTSCDDDPWSAETIAALRERIVKTMLEDERLKELRDPIPEPWLIVKETVTSRSREESVLSVSQFATICAESGDGVRDENEQGRFSTCSTISV